MGYTKDKNLKSKTIYSKNDILFLNTLTVTEVKKILHDNDLSLLLRLYKTILERDTHISSELEKRKLQLISIPFKVIGEDKEKEFIENILFDTLKINKFLKRIASAIGYGFSVLDLVWDIKKIDNRQYYLPISNYFIKQSYCDIDLDIDELYIIKKDTVDKIYLTNTPKYLVHYHEIEHGDITDYALIKKLVWIFTAKNFAISQYMQYIDTLAVPPIIVRSDNEDGKEIAEAILSLRGAGVGAFDSNTMIDVLQGKSQHDFMPFIEYCDRLISQIILGSTLTSNNKGGGSYALGSVHNEVRLDYLKSDAYLIEESMYELIKCVCDFNFDNPNYPKFKFVFKEKKDKKETSEIIKNLDSTGYKISKEDIQNEFGYTIEEKINEPNIQINSKEINSKTPKDYIDTQVENIDLNTIQKKFKDDLNTLLSKTNSYDEAIKIISQEYNFLDISYIEEHISTYLFNSYLQGSLDD